MRREQLWPVAACVGVALLFSVLSAAFPGMRDVNAGSHYALVRALADGTPKIDGYFSYVEDTDYSERDGHRYSDKPPGTATLALPFYAVGRLIAGPDAENRQRVPIDSAAPGQRRVPPVEEYMTNLLSVLAGIAVLFLAVAVCRELGASPSLAWLTAIAIFLGTMVWRYSTVLFSHALASALLLAAVLLGLRVLRRDGRLDLALLGLAGGIGVTVDYSLVVPFVGIAGVALWNRRSARDVGFLVAGAAFPLALLAAYHAWAFGNPFTTAYQYKAREEFEFTRTFGGLYSGSFGNLLRIFGDRSAGLIPWSPLVLLAPFGLLGLWFRSDEAARKRLLLILIAVVPLLILQAKFRTWEGGRTNDARYSTVLLAPMLVGVSHLPALFRERWQRLGAKVAVALLAAAGLVLQSVRLLLSVGHGERLGPGPRIRVDTTLDMVETIQQGLAAGFPSARYLPFTVIVVVALGSSALGVTERRRRARLREPGPSEAALVRVS